MDSMLPRVTAALAPTHPYQRLLYRIGIVLIISGLFHLGVFAVDGGDWWGSVSWRKPMSFGISFGLAALSIGWVLGQLRYRRRLGATVAWVFGVSSILEVAAVSIQRWRGVPSHFNTAEPFNAAVFGIMGVSVLLITVALAAVFVWAIVDRSPDPAVRVAILTGLALLLVASALGNDMITRGTAAVDQTGVVPGGVVIGAAGSAKLAHAVGLHGLQVLGVLAILLGLGQVTRSERVRLMTVAAVAYTGLFGVVAMQAYGGRAVLDLQPFAALVMALSLAALGYSGVVALLGVRAVGHSRSQVAT